MTELKSQGVSLITKIGIAFKGKKAVVKQLPLSFS